MEGETTTSETTSPGMTAGVGAQTDPLADAIIVLIETLLEVAPVEVVPPGVKGNPGRNLMMTRIEGVTEMVDQGITAVVAEMIEVVAAIAVGAIHTEARAVEATVETAADLEVVLTGTMVALT